MDQDQLSQGYGNRPFALSDEPIPDSSNDRLSRDAFAEKLAHVICHLERGKSTVLALTGPWGSGKTSIKNLVIKELEIANNPPRVVEFPPWQVSGTGNISALFFEAILEGVSEEQTTAKDSREKIRKYAGWLSRGSSGMGGLATVLSVAGALGLPFASVASGIARQAGDKMKEASELSKAVVPDEPIDLKKLKAEISGELAKLTQQILVVIDDIDRLPISEICEVVQLVNVNANFPNLHYLLLFDRHAVEKSLAEAFPGKGREFLEKIIQASYHVPVLTRPELEIEFRQYLKKWIQGTPFEKELDDGELTALFETALCRFLGNIRHIKRLMSSLSFYAAQFVSGESTEVNPVDLIALEALRQFEPDVYEALFQNKQFLIEGWVLEFMAKDEAKKERNDALARLVELASEDRRELVRDIITLVFPSIKEISGRNADTWLKEKRVCHSDNFDRYFSYRLGDQDISENDLDTFIKSAETKEFVLRFFQAQLQRGLFHALLHRLVLRGKDIDGAKAEIVAEVLIDLTDTLPAVTDRSNFPTTVSYVSGLLKQMVVNLISPSDRAAGRGTAAVVKNLFEETKGLYLPTSFCFELVRLLNEAGRSIFEITKEEVVELCKLVATKIEGSAYANQLPNDYSFPTLLFFWLRHGNVERLREWIVKEIETPSHFFRLLDAIATPRDFPRFGGSENPFHFNLQTVEMFVGVDLIENKLSSLSAQTSDKRERFLVEAFQWALGDARRESGRSDLPTAQTPGV